jgi:hypothetical protein
MKHLPTNNMTRWPLKNVASHLSSSRQSLSTFVWMHVMP